MGQLATVLMGLLAGSGIITVAGLAIADRRQVSRHNRRMVAYQRRRPAIAVLAGKGMGAPTLALNLSGSEASTKLARWMPGGRKMRELLSRTGRPISMKGYMTATAALGAAALMIFAFLAKFGLVASFAGAGAIAFFIPRFVVQRMAKRRLAAFTKQFPEAIDLIVRALRAGLPLTEALNTIAHECADPVRTEFRKVVGALAISRSVEDALWEIERTIDSAELRFFIISISTQMQTGGNLGETLGNLATILRQRSQMRLKVGAMTGEAKASAMVLGSLPFVIGILMMFTNPSYITPLFTDPRGLVLLAGGAVMLTIGIGTMAKLVSFEI